MYVHRRYFPDFRPGWGIAGKSVFVFFKSLQVDLPGLTAMALNWTV